MWRYLAIYRPERGAPLRPPADLALLHHDHSLSVYGQALKQPCRLADGSGIILGVSFDEAGDRLETLSCAETSKMRQTDGRSLLERFWGGYIAFQTDADAVRVVRDPSAAMPCYWTSHGGSLVLASDPDLMVRAGCTAPSIDWPHLALRLKTPGAHHDATCLLGVRELPRGGRLRLGTDAAPQVESLWSPWTFADRGWNRTPAEAAEALQAVTRRCVRAWASVHDGIVLSLSGGLDSSIIAACLTGSPTPTTALTMVSDDPIGDERVFAQAVAERCGLPLVARTYPLQRIDLSKTNTALQPRPNGRAIAQAFGQTLTDLQQTVGFDALFTGGGGDNVFCAMTSVLPLVDRLKVQGPTLGAWTTLNDLVGLTRCTYHQAISQTLRRLRTPRSLHPSVDDRFLSAEVKALLPPTPAASWLSSAGDRPPGKVEHVRMIETIHNFTEASVAPGVSTVSPLLSQPIVELCAQFPTWMWCAEGHDRALARMAFQDHLPKGVINRSSKGGPDEEMYRVFDGARGFIVETLSNGLLAANGIVDAAAVATYVSGPGSYRDSDYVRVLQLLDAEVWARTWADRASQPPSLLRAVAS